MDLALRAPLLAIQVDVAEEDRLGRTGCLAGGYHLAVSHRPVLALGGDTGRRNPLHAIRALLHHPAAADRDVWIPL